MPELPEVETTLRGIKPHVAGQSIKEIIVRFPTLRWPIPKQLNKLLKNQPLLNLRRRGKYLLFEFTPGTLILHLGMSGRLRVLTEALPPKKHDHVDIVFTNGTYLRFTDPRRFGALLFTKDDPNDHPLLKHLGPEPLTAKFTGNYLYTKAEGRKIPLKSFIMDSKIVTGVGNIYATEALFAAKIKPHKPAGKVSLEQYQALAASIKMILKQAITKGGTTLKDFMKSDGSPGYFSIELQVYGKSGKPCPRCSTTLTASRLGQRSTVYCSACQK